MRPLAPSPSASPFRRIALAIIAVLSLFAAACSGDDDNIGERGLSGPQPAPTIAGRVVDGFAPGVDDRVAIIGVSAGETLPMQALPGPEQPIIAELPPTASDLFGFGQAIETPDGDLWWLVRYGDAQGWIQPGAAYLGAGEDISVEVAGRLERTSYDSMDDLVDDVQSQFGDDAVIVGVTEETDAGDIAATIDALGAEDDSLVGERFIVTANSATGSYRLTGAQRVPLCARGVNASGICQ